MQDGVVAAAQASAHRAHLLAGERVGVALVGVDDDLQRGHPGGPGGRGAHVGSGLLAGARGLPEHHLAATVGDPVQRDWGGGVVEAGLTRDRRPPTQQAQRLHHRAVGGVVAAELRRAEKGGQHLAVVMRVRRAQHHPHPGLEGALIGLGLANQLAQRLLGHHRIQRPAHQLVGMLNGGLGQPEQDPFLTANPAQVSVSSRSTRRSARVLILWTRPISRSTSASVISVRPRQHSAASSVSRTS